MKSSIIFTLWCMLLSAMWAENEKSNAALFEAILGGNVAGISQAVIDGANLHATDAKGRSALLVARISDCHECFVSLLVAGADPDYPGIEDQPLLHSITGPGSIEYLKSAVEFGADVNVEIKNVLGQWEPYLFQAIAIDRANMVQFLLKSGVNTEVFDAEGRSPLQAAFHAERIQNAYILLANGVVGPVDRSLGTDWYKKKLIRTKSRYATPIGEHWIEKVSRVLVDLGLISEEDYSEIAAAEAVEQPVHRRLP